MSVLFALAAGLFALTAPVVWDKIARAANSDIVVPHWGGAGGYWTDMSLVDVTLHEYSDDRIWLTTGRSLNFRFPKAFLAMSVNRLGGAQVSLYPTFDFATSGPFSIWIAEAHENPDPLSDAEKYSLRQEEKRRRVSPSISIRRHGSEIQPLPAYTLEQIVAGEPSAYSSALRVPARHLEEKYCGFDQFDGEKQSAVYKDYMPPFDQAGFFARREDSEKFVTFVSCTMVQMNNTMGRINKKSEYPSCSTDTLYKDMWPVHVVFSGEHLCSYDSLVARVSRVLDEHLAAQTEPR